MSLGNIQHCTTKGKQARAELDNTDYNLCDGTNFWLHELTRKSCILSPFSTSYELMQNVQIDTCFTAYMDDYGRNWTLVFN